jgi:nucleotide-binding universal stress UspA family protein
METLLIATDFSTASHNAAVYGVELAKHLGANVVLCNAYQAVISTADMAIVVTDAEAREISEMGLAKENNSLVVAPSVTVKTIAEEGWASDAVLSAAKKVNAKWIIAGIKGNKVTGRKFFGSTVTELSRHSNRPLILVPEDAKFADIKSIALASDLDNESDITVLDPLHEIGQKFEARMYVVRVIKRGMDDVVEMLMRPTVLKWHFKELKPIYEFEVDDNVAEAMNKFVKEHNVDMIVMIKQDHTFLERIFKKSNTKEMIFEANVPLIILPGKLDEAYPIEIENKAAHLF